MYPGSGYNGCMPTNTNEETSRLQDAGQATAARNESIGKALLGFLALRNAKIDTGYKGNGEIELSWRQSVGYEERKENVLPRHLGGAMRRAVERCQELAELEEHRSGVKAAEEAEATPEPVRQSQAKSYEESERDALEEDAHDLRKELRQSEGEVL